MRESKIANRAAVTIVSVSEAGRSFEKKCISCNTETADLLMEVFEKELLLFLQIQAPHTVAVTHSFFAWHLLCPVWLHLLQFCGENQTFFSDFGTFEKNPWIPKKSPNTPDFFAALRAAFSNFTIPSQLQLTPPLKLEIGASQIPGFYFLKYLRKFSISGF